MALLFKSNAEISSIQYVIETIFLNLAKIKRAQLFRNIFGEKKKITRFKKKSILKHSNSYMLMLFMSSRKILLL